MTFCESCPNCQSEHHMYCESVLKMLFFGSKKTKLPQTKKLKCNLTLTVSLEGEEKNTKEIHFRTDFPCEKLECIIT